MTVYDDPEFRQLLAAIAAHPADDVPRLAFADWLDEHADRVMRCPKCDGYKCTHGWKIHPPGCQCCEHCNRTGTVPDHLAAWAELIRVGCEIPKWEMGNPLDLLRRRERELFARVAPAVWSGERVRLTDECEQCEVHVVLHHRGEVQQFGPGPQWQMCPDCRPYSLVVRRGVAEVVDTTLAAWCGVRCYGCEGTGYSTESEQYRQPCYRCTRLGEKRGTGRIPGVGAAVLARHPTVRAVRTEKVSMPDAAGRHAWFVEGAVAPPENCLPRVVFDLLRGHYGELGGRMGSWFPTREAADAALSDAMITYAKGK